LMLRAFANFDGRSLYLDLVALAELFAGER
jgi:hypothetical protein